MGFRILTLLTLMTLCSLPLLANAATYNWYFSDDAAGNAAGNDTTGDGSEAKPWKTLSKAQSQIDSVNSGDTVNLYFDRGDTWSYNSAQVSKRVTYGIEIGTDDPIVNINAYGSGDKPAFDGLVSNFSSVPVHNQSNGPLKWNTFFQFQRADCSVTNVEIKRVYGIGIALKDDGGLRFTLSYSYIHDFGSVALDTDTTGSFTLEDCVAEYNTMHTGQELYRYSKMSGWGPAIDFNDSSETVDDNIARYNVIYNIYGEGINNMNGITEYNVIGDTRSIAINTSNHANDALAGTIVRYNLIVHSDWSSSIYSSSSSAGIRVFDEKIGGDNSKADISIYGNIVINRGIGIWAFQSQDPGNPYGSVKIYNNTVIDCHLANFYIKDPQEFTHGYVYNNTSILYDRTGSKHANNIDISSTWNVDNNHFWTTGGSPSVPTAWQKNYRTGDPKLPGEPSVDWDGQKGATYFANIDITTHLYPPSGSALVDAGKALGSNYERLFLTAGTDFSALPDNARFQKISQNQDGAWDIGATVHNFNGSSIPPPGELKILN